LQSLVQQGLPVAKSGYLFVYVSYVRDQAVEREKPVFFDNLTVQHYSGPLVEETQYYPFGLVMQGISSRAVGRLENRYKYNGIEEEKSFELNVYDAQFRELDPQTGRWWQIDPKSDEMLMWSTYASNYDNPIRFADPEGDVPGEGECCGELWDKIVDGADNAMLSVSGTLWGVLNTVTFGLVSSDPFNVRPGLTSEKKMYWDNAVEIGKMGPLVLPGARRVSSSGTVVEMVPVGGRPNSQVRVGTQTTIAPTVPVYLPAKGGNNNKGPKDLVAEAKAAQAKEAQSKAREANRQNQTQAGKKKEGQSNQGTRGSHSSGNYRPGKHQKAEARRAREQAAADAKKKNNQ
jgi:RHS repeat-associated protein